MKILSAFVLAAACVVPFSSHAAPLDDAIAELQRDWEVIRYQTPESARLKRFEALSAKAHSFSQTFAGHSEPLVWEGIIVHCIGVDRGWRLCDISLGVVGFGIMCIVFGVGLGL